MQTEGRERSGQREEQPHRDPVAKPHRDPAAHHVKDPESSQPAAEEPVAHGSPTDTQGAVTAGVPLESGNGPPVKMQNLLHQVRSQIRSQAGLTSAKTGMFDLMQQMKDREAGMASLSGLPDVEARDVGGTLSNGDHGKTEPAATESRSPPSFEEELEATRKTLRDEFEQQISQLRVEMRAYASRAVKDMERKMKGATITHGQAKGGSREQTEAKGVTEKKQKHLATAAAPSLTARRSRELTRTMTTIIPKTCPPVIIGPRAKSETLSGSRDSGALLMKESDFSVIHPPVGSSRQPQNRRALPPVLHHPRQKPVWTMAHTGS